LPVDETGLATGAATTLPLPTDTTLIFDSVSPNGRYVLLLEPSEPGGIPYIFDVSSERVWPLFKEYPWAGGRSFGWHPDGHQVLFWSLDVALWLVDADTGEYTVLAQPDGPIQRATISPDGQIIVYAVSTSFSERAFQMVSAAGGDVQPLFVQNSPTQVFGWSPSGDHILYVGEEVQTQEKTSDKSAYVSSLWLMDADGKRQHPLGIPFVLGWSFAPVWSPDGHYIAAAVPTPGEPFPCAEKTGSTPDWENCWYQGTGIYLEDIVTGKMHRLTEGISPVWSPDGRMIAFLSNRSGTSEIWVMNIQDGELHQLTNDGQPKSHTLFWSKGKDGE
jgi:TolB protein